MILNDLRDEIYKDAEAHGLYDDPKYARTNKFGLMHVCSNLAYRIREEVQEAIDAAWYSNFEHFVEELADIIILCLSVSGHLGIDIETAVRTKMAYNKTRSYQHKEEK